MSLLEKLFGSYGEKELKRLRPIADQIESFSDKFKAMSDAELRAMTDIFRTRLLNGETLDDILPEAFAVVRETSDRVLGLRHFYVQLLGGIVLHQGRIAEMKTGEGKTLVATLPAYLNALTGNGVHIVTVNDYLARRDSEWMGKIYKFLGLTVGLITHDVEDKKGAYLADITYGTNNEIGFDYLRDNMVIFKEQMVQRPFNFAIVDEVDSILIDEARTPLIISGQGDKSTQLYALADRFVRTLKAYKIIELDDKVSHDDFEGDYLIDEKAKSVTLTPSGVKKAERAFNIENLMDPENMTLLHHINEAIKAHGIMKRDIDYVVKDGEVLIVDEFTGRIMLGRRYSEGLHQAIEAKEHVTVLREMRTLATITFQNFFRLYPKLSGMTGTALTEQNEFMEIYKLDVVEIPTNRPMIRNDLPDVVYKTEKAKFDAVIDQVIECHKKGQPVLVGTISIEKSEHLSSLLKQRGITHTVLNAKYHDKEAEIVAQAGKKGAVTIATNMAGRGTDIMLGGNAEYMAKDEMRRMAYPDEMITEATAYSDTDNEEIIKAREVYEGLYTKYKNLVMPEAEEVKKAGGVFIMGTERHESRRIDNQLRGRSGRQGDPGESRFFISLEDDLMRLFGSDRIAGVISALGLEENVPIEHKMLSGAIENAQKKVEDRNFSTRKHVLEYDDVMNQQRTTIYDQRRKVLNGEDLHEYILKMIDDNILESVNLHCAENTAPDNWDFEGLKAQFLGVFLDEQDLKYTKDDLETLSKQDIIDTLTNKAMEKYKLREEAFGEQTMREIERVILLQVVDSKWMDHIDDMDQLRQGIGMRAYAQHDPVVEYKIEGYNMFEAMIHSIEEDTSRYIFTVQLKNNEAPKREQVAKPTSTSGDGTQKQMPVRSTKKVGRNDPCPCGSGLKYKKCCGR